MIKKTLIFIALILVIMGASCSQKISKVIKVTTLFNNDKMASNFTKIKDIFPTTEMVAPESPRAIPRNIQSDFMNFSMDQLEETPLEFLKKTNTSGFLVIHEGKVIFDYFSNNFNAETHHISWSMSKTLVAALVGIAVHEGQISSVEDPVEQYAPILAQSPYKGVTIKNVLQMSSGVRFDEDYQRFNSDINKLGRVFALGRSFEKYITKMSKERDQGLYNQYVSMDTQVLAMVLQSAVGQNLTSYCAEKIWTPLGMDHSGYWIVDNKGMEGAFGGLNATIYDYARLGLLYVDHGNYYGNQIIDTAWMQDSWNISEPHLMPGKNDKSNTEFGYGYQWWIPDWPATMYQAQGIYSQYIIVHPEKNIVIVKLSANPHFKDKKVETQKEHNAFFHEIVEQINQ